MKLRLATRGSRLAWTQSGLVAAALQELGHEVELVRITTHGDVTTAPLASLGGAGVFVGAVREAVLSGAADFAVHSFKDLPTAPAPGLLLAAVPAREDPADALCARDGLRLDELPAGARIGTGSPRRAAQLLARRPDLVTVPIRGNVETRLARRNEDLDAVVLAAAGLNRLGLGAAITERLEPSWFLPAPSQGALALECAADSTLELKRILGELDDPATRLAAIAERAVLARLGAGCAAPVGAFATVSDTQLQLSARVVAADGSSSVEQQGQAAADPAAAAELGTTLAVRLLAAGAAQVADLGAGKPGPLAGRVVLIPRRSPSGTAVALAALGAEVCTAEFTKTAPLESESLREALTQQWDWILITSANTVPSLRQEPTAAAALAATKLAAVGPATARALEAAGFRVDLVADPPGGAGLAAALPTGTGRILIPGALESSEEPASGLRTKGWEVTSVAVYQTVQQRPAAELVQRWQAGEIDALLVTAGSVARAASTLGLPGPATVAIGDSAATAAAASGLAVVAVANRPDAAGIAKAVLTALAN